MSNFIVLTIMADDRPGVVEKLASLISQSGGNWLESSMSRLAGKFAGILLVEVATDKKQQLIDTLAALDDISVKVSATQAQPEQTTPSMLLTVLGNDRPGIVSEISSILANKHINVEQLTTTCESAPMSADTLFKATAHIQLPGHLEKQHLLESLEALSDDLFVEINDD